MGRAEPGRYVDHCIYTWLICGHFILFWYLYAYKTFTISCFTFITGISWTSQVTNVSGSYIFIFTLGNATAGMIMLPVGGIIFENDPFNVVSDGLTLIMFILVIYIINYI